MDILKTKALLLSFAYITIDPSVNIESFHNTGNLARDSWIFIKLNNKSRVRMIISDNSSIRLCKDQTNGVYVFNLNSKEIIVDHVEIEKPIAHAPEQMFITLYRNCVRGCKFCPLTYSSEKSHHSLDDILGRISSNETPKSIGITTSNPPNLDTKDVVDEICFVVKKIKSKYGDEIPIGASMNSPSDFDIENLKKSGVIELRINLETPNQDLAKALMPNKKIESIYHSIETASNIFGKNKVSSNIILGLGESDLEVTEGIRRLASLGSIATLYPYDKINGNYQFVKDFIRPSYKRLYKLAKIHKNILEEYSLNPLALKTMCGSCAASHILPYKDF